MAQDVATEARRTSERERAVGCLVGLAVGDALGAAVEFRPPGTFPPVTGMRGGGAHGLEPGEWTDDTSMALAMADSILEVGWDIDDQARRYVEWRRHGRYSVNGECFDIGVTTAAALDVFERTGDARISGRSEPMSAGNGSIMRLAPAVIVLADRYPADLEGLVSRCVESSLPTHRAPQALSACAVFGVILAALIQGEPKDLVLDPDWTVWDDLRELFPLHSEVEEVMSGSHLRREPPDIVGSGYVVRSLEAALWAFGRNEDFELSVLAAVNLGDDADTTGAICGQMCGAWLGVTAIPQGWLAELAWADEILRIGGKLGSSAV